MDGNEPIDPQKADAAGMSRKAIVALAQKRERMIIERFEHIVRSYERALESKARDLNGMTQLLGCMLERFGECDVPLSDVEAMDPGRMYVIEEDGTWRVRIRDDASKPVELSYAPEFLPDEALDQEKMAADGVTKVRLYDA